MNKFLKGLAVFLSCLLAVLIAVLIGLIVSDNRGGDEIMQEYEIGAHREYLPTDEYVKPIGRTLYKDGKRYFSHSGSGIEFICKGSYAEITLCSAHTYGVSANHKTRFAIYLDDMLIIDETVDYDEKTYRISTSYKGSKITLIKLSEAMYSSFAVSTIAAYGMADIAPTEKNDFKIEFIGDSITCGYGIDEGAFGSFSTSTENFSKTYAYLTAKALGADYSAVCFSGYGVVSGFTSNGVKNNDLVMPKYDKTCFLPDGEYLWDFSSDANDIVVVNLGTNDASYCSDSYQRRLEFIEAYISLLEQVRQNNPTAYILCILGDMNNSLYSSIETAVTRFREEKGDFRAEAFMVDFKMGENDVVIDGHPGEKSNAEAAAVLTEKIREIMTPGYLG